jgi:hypothetical protein
MPYRHLYRIAFTALLALSGCLQALEPKPPKQPVAQAEPDTARSTVRAVINGRPWGGRTWDTVLTGAYLLNGRLATSSNISLSSIYTDGFHFVVGKTNLINLRFSISRLVQADEFINKENRKDTLYTSQVEHIVCGVEDSTGGVVKEYIYPQLTDCKWWQGILGDEYRPSTGREGITSWSISYGRLQKTLSDVSFDAYVASNTTHTMHISNAVMERSSLTIDSYRENPNRMSGRFSFRMRHPLTGEVIDIKDGVFDNVKFIKSVR